MYQNSGQGKNMKINDNIHLISSTLKTVASEIVTSAELEQQDKPLEEVLNEKTQEATEQSKRN